MVMSLFATQLVKYTGINKELLSFLAIALFYSNSV